MITLRLTRITDYRIFKNKIKQKYKCSWKDIHVWKRLGKFVSFNVDGDVDSQNR